MGRWGVWLVVGLLAAGGLYVSLSQDSATELLLVGIVDGDEIVVSSTITARIDSLLVREGDLVSAGDLVATLDQSQLAAAAEAATAVAEQAHRNALVAEAEVRLLGDQLPPAILEAQAVLEQARARDDEARAALAQAVLSYDRIRSLSDSGLATAQQLDDARTARQTAEAAAVAANRAVGAAEAALQSAEARRSQLDVEHRRVDVALARSDEADANKAEAAAKLDQTTLVAPVGGVVSLLVARQGEVVTPGDPVLTIYRLDDTWVQAYAPETYADRVALGDTLPVTLPSGARIDGEVVLKAVEAGFATQRDITGTKPDIKTIGFRLRVPNLDGRLARGMTATVTLPLADR